MLVLDYTTLPDVTQEKWKVTRFPPNLGKFNRLITALESFSFQIQSSGNINDRQKTFLGIRPRGVGGMCRSNACACAKRSEIS